MRALAVFGPTASGKSSLAFKLAKELGGVIISADSMQIYRNMDIGTAKPTLEEQKEVPHRLIDICDAKERFSVYDYKALAENEIRSACSKGQIPIVVGGTGLYFDALFYNTDFGEFDVSEEVRLKLKARAENGENENLLAELKEIDPETAAPLHPRDLKRIVRGLEVFYSTGKTLSYFKSESHRKKSEIDFCKFNLVYKDREILYQRINLRVDQMVAAGLLEETRTLLESGALSDTTAAQAIGYKELLPHLTADAPFSDCISLLKQKTRNYAKRQITWFRRYTDSHQIIMDETEDPFSTAMSIAKDFFKEV